MTLRERDIAALAALCRDKGAADVWHEFVRRLQPLVAGVVVKTCRRCGVNDVSIFDDLIQEVFLKFCKNTGQILQVAQEKDENSFYGYIKVLTANVVFDHYKYRLAEKRRYLAEEELDEALPDKPASGADLLHVDVERVLREENITERDQSIFWLYYRQGFSATEIARMAGSGLGVKGVESCLYRVTSMLRDRFAVPTSLKGGEC